MSNTLPGKVISFSFSYITSSVLADGKEEVSRENITVPLFVDMGVGIGGDTWPAAELFCDFVSSNKYYSHFQNLFTDKSILELGSGNGMVSIMLEKCFQPKSIVVTDMESHVSLIDHNLRLNGSQICVAQSLDWFNIPPDQAKFDVLLALEW